MRKITLSCRIAYSLFVALAGSTAFAQLYTEDFDDMNAANRWTAFAGVGFIQNAGALQSAPMDTNFDNFPFIGGVDGVNDDLSGFSFDYGAAGVPSAPHSTGGSTIGMKLQADLFSNALGGFSVSPNGVNLTGDYSLKFDAWSSTLGPFPGGGDGSTNLSTFGILTAGTKSQTLLSSDGVFFGYTGDGGSGSDFRAYSVDEMDSYNLAGTDGDGNPVPAEANATHFALDSNGDPTRNAPGELYGQAVGTENAPPQSVIKAFPGQDMSGTLQSGASAFVWQENEIRKVGSVVDWYVNGFKLISVDTAGFDDPTEGGNISFGHTDINFSSSLSDFAGDLLFTLIDNIEVTTITPSVDNADFDGSGLVDGADFLKWQQNVGTPDALQADGDANGDMMVDDADLAIFQAQYGGAPPVAAATASVPEPAAWMALAMAACLAWGFSRPRRAVCPVRVK